MKNKDFLTTSEAARLLSVSPDTVLKWVKAGKIKSRRTLGGHFRIPTAALDVPSGEEKSGIAGVVRSNDDFVYCWEYLARDGEIKPECHECITFRSRSQRCYELRDLPEGFGCLAMQCADQCEDCEYYRLVQGSLINILILSESGHMGQDGDAGDQDNEFNIKYVSDEYEMASTIQSFRPDYIVIDCGIGKKRTASLCTNLFNDARMPVARIILSSKSRDLSEYCDKDVFGWIRKPISISRLRSCIKSVPGRGQSNH